MRFLLLALLASTGCEQILGLEDIEGAGGGVDGLTGRVTIFGRTTGQDGIGVEMRRDSGELIAGTEVSTSGGGNFQIALADSVAGYLRFFDETTGIPLDEGVYHIQDGLNPGSAFQLTAFESSGRPVRDAFMTSAALPPALLDLPFARVEIIGGDYRGLSGASISVTGPGAVEIRYTNAGGQPVPGLATTTAADRGDGETFGCAYVFGLLEDNEYVVEAMIEADIATLGHSIYVPPRDADVMTPTNPIVVLRFPNR